MRKRPGGVTPDCLSRSLSPSLSLSLALSLSRARSRAHSLSLSLSRCTHSGVALAGATAAVPGEAEVPNLDSFSVLNRRN